MTRPMISVAGIRGVVGDSLTPELFLRYVLSFGTLMEGGRIVVGSDSRLSREMLRDLAFSALSSTGCEIYDIGLAPTPTVGLMVRELGAAGGIAITASHNPAEWNAYKFFDEQGSFLNKEQNAKLLQVAENGNFRRVNFLELGKKIVRTDAIELHLSRIYSSIDIAGIIDKRFRVVVDCVNGVGGLIATPLLEKLGCESDIFDTDVNAVFPRVAEPLPENLGKLGERVKQMGADIGFAIDPDADRLAIVDSTGRPIGEERTLTLCAVSVLQRTKGPIVANLSTTRALDDVARRFDVPLYRTPIGEAHVVGKIREVNAVIGGEGNGGVIYPPIHPGRDAASGIALILDTMAHTGKSIMELNADVPDYRMVKTKFDVGGVDVAQIIARMKEAFPDASSISTEDGVKVDLRDSWVHMRPSGTEPVIRVFAEGPTVEAAQQLVTRVNSLI